MVKSYLPIAMVLALTSSTAVFAQTTATPPANTTPPAATMPKADAMPSAKMEAATLSLTDAQAKAWVDKVVYSSDGTNLGEVAAFARDATGKVTEMHADIGGFLGIGETRVRVLPSQFALSNDRVVLTITAEQARTLPVIPKS